MFGSESELIEFVGRGSEALPLSQPREPVSVPPQPKVTAVHAHPPPHVTKPDEMDYYYPHFTHKGPEARWIWKVTYSRLQDKARVA